MADPRIERLAKLLVAYSTQITPGDRVIIEAEPAAEILVRALFERILEAGGHPHLLISLSGMVSMTGLDDVFLRDANEDQLDHVPVFYQHAYENFEARIRIHSATNTKALTHISQEKKAQRRVATGSILQAQMNRGDQGDFHWLTTLFPTAAYAQDAEMSLKEFEDFVLNAGPPTEADSKRIRHIGL